MARASAKWRIMTERGEVFPLFCPPALGAKMLQKEKLRDYEREASAIGTCWPLDVTNFVLSFLFLSLPSWSLYVLYVCVAHSL